MSPAVETIDLTHRYGTRTALDDLSLRIDEREIFALLGPNGGGKTTLFRLLSTLLPIQSGRACVLGHDLATEVQDVRRDIGVVFQAPSLDKKLTVSENLLHQGHLYGLHGAPLAGRAREMLARFGLADRKNDLAEKLSGGLRRRVELAKGMLHAPRLLLLDEPSTSLDPAARVDVWNYLEEIRREDGVTVVLTTHILEEAERADRVGILHAGRLVALDEPAALKSAVGGDSINIVADRPVELAAAIAERFGGSPRVVDGAVRFEREDAHHWIPRLVEAFPGRIETLTLARPTLEDVFIARTGHRFWRDAEEPSDE